MNFFKRLFAKPEKPATLKVIVYVDGFQKRTIQTWKYVPEIGDNLWYDNKVYTVSNRRWDMEDTLETPTCELFLTT